MSVPHLLAADHDISLFDCGTPILNDWLRKRAMRNQIEGASRTFVVCAGSRVIGFYCLAAGSVLHLDATGKVRRNMPDPIPVMVLGRLAVDRAWKGRGVGGGLLRDAVLRTAQVTQNAGIRAMIIHAKDEDAKRFYERHGFRPSPTSPLALMVTLREIPAGLE